LADCETAPLPGDSAPLFIEPGGQPADHRRLIELLTARLGPGCLLQPGHVADHRPEHANTWTPVEAGGGAIRASGALAFYPQRPFWLLPEPQPLAEVDDRPIHGTPLRLIHGPERIEAGWWAGALTARDYYIA